MEEIVEHLRDPYRVYCIQLNQGINKRAGDAILYVHIARPVSFKTVCEKFIFQHLELTMVKTGEKIPIVEVVGIQKVPNGNKPKYELTLDGNLIEILG